MDVNTSGGIKGVIAAGKWQMTQKEALSIAAGRRIQPA
jgi:hypothetical protein